MMADVVEDRAGRQALRMPRRRFLLAAGSAGIALAELSRVGVARPAAARAPGEPSPVRALLRRAGGDVEAATAQVACDGAYALRELGAATALADMKPAEVVTVGRDGAGLWFQVGDGHRQGPLPGPLQAVPADSAGRLIHASAGTDRLPSYRGVLELAAGSEGCVVLVNVVNLEDYLAGVLPREMPATFGPEALKAQAVASRGFALSRMSRGTHRQQGADVCDAIDCQAYGGIGSEQPAHGVALDATRGQVLLRAGALFEPLYSSTCGGHTEALSRQFGSGSSDVGILEAVADGPLPPGADLSTDDAASQFYKQPWDSHCAAAPRYRWSVRWDRRRLEEILIEGLRRLAGSSAVTPAFPPDGSIGSLNGVFVAQRGLSGRALELRVEASNGTWTVQRDWNVRNLLRTPSGDALSSSAIVLEAERGADGRMVGLTAFGGGWGHGVGMCQWGARGLAKKGWTYDMILAHYFPGTELVSSQ